MATHADKGSLHLRTQSLLKECDAPLIEIYEKTRLPYFWLKKFSSGEIKDPSVNRVQKLYEHLAGKKLEV